MSTNHLRTVFSSQLLSVAVGGLHPLNEQHAPNDAVSTPTIVIDWGIQSNAIIKVTCPSYNFQFGIILLIAVPYKAEALPDVTAACFLANQPVLLAGSCSPLFGTSIVKGDTSNVAIYGQTGWWWLHSSNVKQRLCHL